jgi:hypothetical protein
MEFSKNLIVRIYSSLIFFLLFGTSLLSTAQTTAVHGSMPKNGASGLLRNVVISVGLGFASSQSGIDPRTLNANTVRIFQKNLPQQFVEAFLIADDYLQSLVVEPVQLLEPQTEYVFEITSGFKDLVGNSFGPYRIEFTTGEKVIAKRTATNRPQVIHKRKNVYRPPHTQVASILVPAANPKPSAQPEEQSPSPEIDSAKNSVPDAPAVEDQVVSTEKPNSPPPKTESPPESPAKIAKARFSFPKSEIATNERLPLLMDLPDKTEVKYIIKNTSGQIVKEGTAKFKTGQHKKSVSLGDLEKGRYLILIKGGEGKARHIFEIK